MKLILYWTSHWTNPLIFLLNQQPLLVHTPFFRLACQCSKLEHARIPEPTLNKGHCLCTSFWIFMLKAQLSKCSPIYEPLLFSGATNANHHLENPIRSLAIDFWYHLVERMESPPRKQLQYKVESNLTQKFEPLGFSLTQYVSCSSFSPLMWDSLHHILCFNKKSYTGLEIIRSKWSKLFLVIFKPTLLFIRNLRLDTLMTSFSITRLQDNPNFNPSKTTKNLMWIPHGQNPLVTLFGTKGKVFVTSRRKIGNLSIMLLKV